jgi:hypothetical protein
VKGRELGREMKKSSFRPILKVGQGDAMEMACVRIMQEQNGQLRVKLSYAGIVHIYLTLRYGRIRRTMSACL